MKEERRGRRTKLLDALFQTSEFAHEVRMWY